ncbi:MAG: hypothetical protein Q4G27_08330 [Flavobacteriaceae bacterium]|nr:hypothetical protein [Flavobacteriaceae bacterium]
MKTYFLILLSVLFMTAKAQENKQYAQEYTAVINGKSILELDADNEDTFTIKVFKENKTKDDNFTSVYNVSEYMLKIPGLPTKSVKGGQINLKELSEFIKSGDSWHIFNIAIMHPLDQSKIIKEKTRPVVIDFK